MYLVFDIGASKMRLAVSKDGERFDAPRIVKTPKNFDDGILRFSKAAREVARGGKIQAAAGGVAGPLNKERTKLARPPNLPDWSGKPMKKELERALGAPVFLENDTALVGLGEAVAGAGKGKEIVVYVTVSSGVNGVRIVRGRIDENRFGFEVGHQIINFDGASCRACKTPGHLEAYISGTALEERYGKKPYEITDELVWDETARYLAYGLNNMIVHWSPDIVILGGSMMKEIGIPIDRVRHHLKDVLKIFPEIPPIEKAALGDVGGLHGALKFLKQNLNDD